MVLESNEHTLTQIFLPWSLQKLEQEKHVLRQKLAIAEEESEQRVLELQTDLNELKDKLQAQVFYFVISS